MQTQSAVVDQLQPALPDVRNVLLAIARGCPAPAPQSEAAAIAEELGLTVQAARYGKRTDIAEQFGHVCLSDDEWSVWDAFCPTAYFENRTGRVGESFSDYGFDLIPAPVLKYWRDVKRDYAFDEFQIWTVEENKQDPLLIGIYAGAHYLLARWGTESPELLPFHEVARQVADRFKESITYSDSSERVLLPLLFALVGTLAAVAAYAGMEITDPYAVIPAFVGSGAAGLALALWLLEKERCQHPVVRAAMKFLP